MLATSDHHLPFCGPVEECDVGCGECQEDGLDRFQNLGVRAVFSDADVADIPLSTGLKQDFVGYSASLPENLLGRGRRE